MQRCPNCNARADGSTNCRRCCMDLTLLLRTEQAAQHLTQQALAQLATEDLAAAKQSLRQAQALQDDPLSAHLLRFIQHDEAQARALGARRHRILDANPWD
jgi:Tfp pilus assembly protein PilF